MDLSREFEEEIDRLLEKEMAEFFRYQYQQLIGGVPISEIVQNTNNGGRVIFNDYRSE